MPEGKKVPFLIRGVQQEVFGGLIRNPPKTVGEFISEATTIKKTLGMPTRQYNCRTLTANYTDVQALVSDGLLETIRAVILEELK